GGTAPLVAGPISSRRSKAASMVWASVWSGVLANSAADMNENPLPARFVGARQRDVSVLRQRRPPHACAAADRGAGRASPPMERHHEWRATKLEPFLHHLI